MKHNMMTKQINEQSRNHDNADVMSAVIEVAGINAILFNGYRRDAIERDRLRDRRNYLVKKFNL